MPEPHEPPPELAEPDAPPGTPVAEQVAENAAPVWCAHGVRWQQTGDGWWADDAPLPEHLGHDVPAQHPGAIPCQPTYASREAWEALAPARELMPDDE